ncbi:lytic transglycosylase domain-containing protein [Actinomadura sp. WMMB 499]|uniref:aggregation-promoting factor C-terminal-like domain-containing protein n=1 Tax=Actinomadura sp. WMMB 499 TaxID=1219491 RepID=UPI001C3FC78C|nr:lytic transglycosylase domain-containing protein [Actinomadura sp. WMMB 499]
MTAVCLAAVAAFLVFVPIGGEDDAEPPKIDAQGMSANEMLEMLRGSEMDPIAADAVASAKKRAYEKQQAAAKQEKAEKNSDETAKSSFDKPEPEAAVGGGGGPLPDAPAGGGNTSVSENKAIGKQMNAVKGWSGCWSALESLWTKESGWNERAQNPSSGAYGIPQSLPGTKMASAGSDWQTNARTQIAWGLNYIDARYGTPCEAWGHSQSVGWY